jgi:hypothetical protein
MDLSGAIRASLVAPALTATASRVRHLAQGAPARHAAAAAAAPHVLPFVALAVVIAVAMIALWIGSITLLERVERKRSTCEALPAVC